jgi:hypothetical protein
MSNQLNLLKQIAKHLLTPKKAVIESEAVPDPIPMTSPKICSRDHIPIDAEMSSILTDPPEMDITMNAEREFLTECITEIEAIPLAHRSGKQKCTLSAYQTALANLEPAKKVKPDLDIVAPSGNEIQS